MKTSHINLLALLITILLLAGVLIWDELLSYTPQIFLISILLVGIPHGAIDHLIFFKKKNVSGTSLAKFYGQYVGLIFVVGVIWYLFPAFSFITFLLISAYHFGQSQLYYFEFNTLISNLLYVAWGLFVLSSIILFNYEECQSIFESFDWLNAGELLSFKLVFLVYTLSSFILCIGFISAYLFKNIKVELIVFEVVLLLILITFSLKATAVFTFAIYFGLWHSLKSLILEYKEVKTIIHTPIKFIVALLPFTLMSLLGLLGAYYFLTFNFTDISPYMVFIVLISALTVPHFVVMSRLYESAS